MKMTANFLRIGHILEYEGGLWRVLRADFVQQQQRAAYKQVEMRNLVTGTKINRRFGTDESITRAVLEQRPMQFLYGTTFMDMTTYDQVELTDDVIGENAIWLQPSMEVTIEFHNSQPLTLILPEKIEAEVVEADPVVKGQTAASSYKPAKISNGASILVPPFISAGERIIVSTVDNTYVERVKK